MLSTAAAPACTPTGSARGVPSLHVLASTGYLSVFFWGSWESFNKAGCVGKDRIAVEGDGLGPVLDWLICHDRGDLQQTVDYAHPEPRTEARAGVQIWELGQ